MRIVVLGQQAFGAEAFRALRERGHEVVGVYCAPDRPGRGRDPLAEAADAAGVSVHQPASFDDAEVVEQVRCLAPDLIVMAFVTIFVPETVLSIPRLGAIQYHPSLLPLHRGPSAINWAIANGDEKTGVTIFWPDEGLDTGPVLLRREVEITEDDTVGSLYFDKLFPIGIEALLESVELVERGEAPKDPQDESEATFEPFFRKDNAEVDWTRPSADVIRLIRATDPRPGAWTMIDGEPVDVFDAVVIESRIDSASPGQIIGVDESGLLVATGDGAVAIGRVRAGERKIGADDYAREAGLKPGTLLGSTAPVS